MDDAKKRPCERCFTGTEKAVLVDFWTCDSCDRGEIEGKEKEDKTNPGLVDWSFCLDFND